MARRGTQKDVHEKSFRDLEHSQTENIVYGLNAVLEAVRAGKRSIDSITVLESARPERLKLLFELARQKRIPVHRVPKLDVGENARHQGVIARIAAARYADAEELRVATSGHWAIRWLVGNLMAGQK